MARDLEKRLSPPEVEVVLRRSAQFGARRWRPFHPERQAISAENLVRVAQAAGISEEDVRRAVGEVFSEKVADPPTLQRSLLGPSRLRVGREISQPAREGSAYLEELMREEQGLRLRHRTETLWLWDPGNTRSVVRRALDLSSERPLLKARSVEVSVEETDPERCAFDLICDLSNQRSEYLSLAGIVGVTLAVLFVFAGIQSGLFLLGVLPALAAPLLGFRFAYFKTRSDVRSAIEQVLDEVARGRPRERASEERGARPPGQIQGLKPIPRFAPSQREDQG